MKERARISIDLNSQDLSLKHMESFRDIALVDPANKKGSTTQELIMFSAKARPYQFSSLNDFKNDLGSIPDDTGYFYYSITQSSGNRCALYLDPDRPAKMVIEGKTDFVESMSEKLKNIFPKGGKRYVLHGRWGFIGIWVAVILIAFSVIFTYSFLSEPNPYLISWVLFVSSILGIYLSIAKAKDINPANTMALGNRPKKPIFDTMLHFLTIVLGIISVILIILFIEFNL